jgi:predicted nuclease of predicted toxin-antitoxin system
VTLSYYFDHHVPPGVARGLERRAVDVLTAQSDGTAAWSDEELLERATLLNRILYTQDEDFLQISDDWRGSEQHHAGIVYAHQQSITVGQTIADLELIAKAMTAEEMRDLVIFLPFKSETLMQD